MPIPGVDVSIRDSAPARSAPTDTGVAFIAGLTEKGKLAPILITSMSDYDRVLGSRVSYGLLYDWLDTFFREGGSRAYVSRVVGPTPVHAGITLNDAGAAATLRVEANSPGEWGNSLNVQVTAGGAGGTFVLIITHDVLGVLETSPDLVDKAAAFMWAVNSNWIRLVDQASLNDPAVVASQNLAGGLDDRAAITDTQWQNAIDRFTKDLGPGQLAAPGQTTTVRYTALKTHAKNNRRVALLDAADTPTKATLTTAANSNRTDGRHAGYFWPWVLVPGITANPATPRAIPPSAVIAGIIARNDPAFSPARPAAGDDGISRYAIGLTQVQFTDTDRQDLNNSGVNVIREMYQTFRNYGWRSLADPVLDQNWVNLGYARGLMAIANEADIIGETFIFELLDGQRRTINRFGAALTGMLIPYWVDGTLYGETPDQAFFVDVGTSVNTIETIADFELRAAISVKLSPYAEHVVIEIVKKLITEEV